MAVNINESWKAVLNNEFKKPYFSNLVAFIKSEYKNYTIYPRGKDIFRAFNLCDFESTKIVLIGQDPYHGFGQANGLCFSVNNDIKVPPSLINIFKEIESDLGVPYTGDSDLSRWSKQGVLLLNSVLTVRANMAGSHRAKGWETFTDAVVKSLASQKSGLVFMLWGAYAKNKAECVDSTKHLVLRAAHPSPFSANNGFLGCMHFSKANEYLKQSGLVPISW